MSMRLGIDRASWFFFANEQRPSSLYTRSGLTGSVDTDFKKKQTFQAFEHVIEQLGSTYFLETVQENDEAWMYLFGREDGTPTHLVAWRPIAVEEDRTIKIEWKTDLKPNKMMIVDGLSQQGKILPKPIWKDGEVDLNIGATPVIVGLEKVSK